MHHAWKKKKYKKITIIEIGYEFKLSQKNGTPYKLFGKASPLEIILINP